jgi:hypothetical protein
MMFPTVVSCQLHEATNLNNIRLNSWRIQLQADRAAATPFVAVLLPAETKWFTSRLRAQLTLHFLTKLDSPLPPLQIPGSAPEFKDIYIGLYNTGIVNVQYQCR